MLHCGSTLALSSKMPSLNVKELSACTPAVWTKCRKQLKAKLEEKLGGTTGTFFLFSTLTLKSLGQQISPAKMFSGFCRSMSRKKSSATLIWLPKEAQLDFKEQKSELWITSVRRDQKPGEAQRKKASLMVQPGWSWADASGAAVLGTVTGIWKYNVVCTPWSGTATSSD